MINKLVEGYWNIKIYINNQKEGRKERVNVKQVYHVVIWKIWIQIHYDYFTCQLRNSSKNNNCCCTWKEQNPTLHTPLVKGHPTDSLDTGKSEVMEKKCHVKPNMGKAASLLDILSQYLYVYLYVHLCPQM